MTTLNLAYLLNIFNAARQGTEGNSYAIVPAEAEEVKALVKAKYIKTNKRLHNADGNVGAVICDGATEADLRVDFEIPDFPAEAQVAPVQHTQEAAPQFDAPAAPFATSETDDMTQLTQQAAPVAPAAPAAPVFEQPAPVLEQVAPAAPFPVGDVAQPDVNAAPLFEATQEVVQEAVHGADVHIEDGVRLIGGADHQVVTTVETRTGTVEIDVGVPYAQKLSKTALRKEVGTVAHHPYDDIAKVKQANPKLVPSFHLPDRTVKNMGSSVKRANIRYEAEGSNITFRASTVGADDPKGAGVRVYAFFVEEAPPARTVKKKDE